MIRVDPAAASAEDLAGVIRSEGYAVRRLDRNALVIGDRAGVEPRQLLRFETEPEFYRLALESAAVRSMPVLIDFWAKWCGPCKRCKELTLRDEKVAEALQAFLVLEVDTDEHPGLAQAYGVSAIPDVVIATPEGRVADWFHGFEEASRFLARLNRVTGVVPPGTPSARPPKQGVLSVLHAA